MTILSSYLKSQKVQKVLTTKPGEEGFSLIELVVVIAVLAILSAVAIPSFTNVQANARASAVQNGLVNGIKECVVRAADNKTTLFLEAQSFTVADAYQGYTIGQVGSANTCYSALAEADAATESDFQIVMDTSTGAVAKTCTNDTAPGCNGDDDDTAEAGTW